MYSNFVLALLALFASVTLLVSASPIPSIAESVDVTLSNLDASLSLASRIVVAHLEERICKYGCDKREEQSETPEVTSTPDVLSLVEDVVPRAPDAVEERVCKYGCD